MRKTDKESNASYFRSPDRFIRVNEEWWFTTREGDQGPFASKEAAEEAAISGWRVGGGEARSRRYTSLQAIYFPRKMKEIIPEIM